MTLKISLEMIDNKNIKIKCLEKELDIEFSLDDETYDKLDKFMDFLLDYDILKEYESIEFDIENYDNLTDVQKNISEGFVEIWKEDYKSIQEDLNSNKDA